MILAEGTRLLYVPSELVRIDLLGPASGDEDNFSGVRGKGVCPLEIGRAMLIE